MSQGQSPFPGTFLNMMCFSHAVGSVCLGAQHTNLVVHEPLGEQPQHVLGEKDVPEQKLVFREVLLREHQRQRPTHLVGEHQALHTAELLRAGSEEGGDATEATPPQNTNLWVVTVTPLHKRKRLRFFTLNLRLNPRNDQRGRGVLL